MRSPQIGSLPSLRQRQLKLFVLLLIIALIIATLALSPSRPSMPIQAQTSWQLTWSDEFNGAANTFPDPNKWQIEVVANPANNEAQYYTNRIQNVRQNGLGQLELIALKEAYGGKQYTSGRINTAGRFEQTYGRWEARMKLPAGTGLWPAFWMLGNDIGTVNWPQSGEIDWMENRGREPRNSSSALHGPGYSGATPLNHTYTLPAGAPSFFDDYHIFSGEWDASQIRFYVDGNLHYTVNRSQVEVYGQWVYNHPFFIILNLAVGGVFDGNQLPPDSAFPARVLVDYVRVYKQGVAPTPTTNPNCPATNIALGRPASSSSNESASYTPNLAFDGNTTTRWSSAFSDPQWIYVDLGSTRTICRVRLNWEAAYSTSYQVQVSNDAATWNNIYTTTAGNGGIDDLGVSGSGRYLRVHGSARGTPYGHSLFEVEVFASNVAPTATRTRTNTSSVATATRTRTNTVGGPTATRTRTNTVGGPTATRTRTRTNTTTGPTATRTNTTASGTPAWAPNTFYAVGATVSYAGINYRCLQAHTSQVGWEPPNVPALWQRI